MKKPELLTACRWMDAINTGLADIEPYAPVEILGVQTTPQGHVQFRVAQPSKPSPEAWAINSGLRIVFPQGSGQITFDSPHIGQHQADDVVENNRSFGHSSATNTYAQTQLGQQNFAGFTEYFSGGGYAAIGDLGGLIGAFTHVSPVLTKATYSVSVSGVLSTWTDMAIDSVHSIADAFELISHTGTIWSLQAEPLCAVADLVFGDSTQDGKVQAKWQHLTPGFGWQDAAETEYGLDYVSNRSLGVSVAASFRTAGTQIRLRVNSSSGANGCTGTVTFWR